MKEYEIGLYEKAIRNSLSWKEKLLCAKECGYDYLELCVDASDERIAPVSYTHLYLFFQKYFVEGVAASGIKG